MKIKKIKEKVKNNIRKTKTLFSFRILFLILSLFFSFFGITYSNDKLIGCEGFMCNSEIKPPEIGKISKDISEVIVSYDPSMESNKNRYVFKDENFSKIENNNEIIYQYVNSNGEAIIFDKKLNSCNISKTICYGNGPNSSITYDVLGIFNHNDFIIFIDKYNLYIFSKKLSKFLIYSLSIYSNFNNYGSKSDVLYDRSNIEKLSFQVIGNNLKIYKSYSSIKFMITFSFDLEKLNENFMNYYYFGNSFSFYLDQDFYNYRYDKEKKENLKFYFYRLNSGYDDYINISNLGFLTISLDNNQTAGFDVLKTLKSKEYIKLEKGEVYYLGKDFVFFTSSLRGAVEKNEFTIGYNKNGEFQLRYLNLNWYDFATSYTLLSVYFNKNDEKYYLSFLTDGVFTKPKFMVLRFAKNDFLTLNNVEIFENAFYLGNYGNLHFHSDNSILKLNFVKNLVFTPFFFSRKGDDLHFYRIGDDGYTKNLNYYESVNPVISGSSNPDINLNFYSDFSSSPFSKKDDVVTKDENGKVIDEDYIAEKEKLLKDKEINNKQADEIISRVPFFSEIINYIKLGFSFPDDFGTRLKIPLLIPAIQNGKPKINYKTQETELRPIEDKLNISNVGEGSEISKKVISAFLAFLYFVFRSIIFSLSFIIIYFTFSYLSKFSNFIFGDFFSSNSSGNLFTFASLIVFLTLVFSFITTFFSSYSLIFPFFTEIINLLNLIFGFLVQNFFDFQFFKQITNLLSTIFTFAVGFIGVKAAIKFGKIF